VANPGSMRFLLLAAALLAMSGPVAAQDRCSHETLAILGTPVTVSLCLAATPVVSGSIMTATIAATYAGANSTFTQNTSVRFVDGEGPARALESVDLHPLGLMGTLHMTLLYADGLVTIEHAMLTPGAVRVK
jgi:hypothetical protein